MSDGYRGELYKNPWSISRLAALGAAGAEAAPAAPAPAAPAAAAPGARGCYEQARIQLRLPDGNSLSHTFSAKEQLAAVRYAYSDHSSGFGTIMERTLIYIQ